MSTCRYPGCEYDDSSHRPYARKRDGVPSVSTISGCLDANDKARAFGWSASLIAATTAVHETPRWWHMPTHLDDGSPCTHEKGGLCRCCLFIRSEFDRVWRAKADLGSHIHHLALSWAKGESVDTDETTEPYMDALEKFYVEYQPEFIHLERTVRDGSGDTPNYRGQFDFIAKTGPLGKTGLWDIKTGSFHPVEQTLQLAAYRFADWLTIWADKREIKDKPMLPVDEAGVLMLHPDGTFELIQLPADRTAYMRFKSLLLAWQWAHGIEKWAKTLKGGEELVDVSEVTP